MSSRMEELARTTASMEAGQPVTITSDGNTSLYIFFAAWGQLFGKTQSWEIFLAVQMAAAFALLALSKRDDRMNYVMFGDFSYRIIILFSEEK